MMNNETKFLGYNSNEGVFVVMEVIGCTDGSKVIIDTGDGNHDVEFNIWDLLKAMRRYKRYQRKDHREGRWYIAQRRREEHL